MSNNPSCFASITPSRAICVSSTETDLKPPQIHGRQGGMLRTTFTTFPSLSRKVASIGKRMKKVWMQLHFVISIPVRKTLASDKALRPFGEGLRDFRVNAENCPSLHFAFGSRIIQLSRISPTRLYGKSSASRQSRPFGSGCQTLVPLSSTIS